ncbi:MAG: HAD-IC family P-type ATPase [Chloroflexi bacterium]|nr:HAD-IC family P-type ATPase [Chloroflexota bacterium]
MNGNAWYQLEAEQVFETLATGKTGLTSDEARARLEKYGYNELTFKKQNPFIRFLLQFHNPLIYILLAAALICALLSTVWGEDMWNEVWIILLVVIVNTILGFVQEGRAEAALEALRRMMVSECSVLRDGMEKTILARELVPGDIVLLNSGDKVAADLRLFYTKNLAADEASLTGDSVPVEKHVEAIPRPDLSPGDQSCMAFSGTFITRGSARGVVVATGERTEFGKIAELVKETARVITPLQRKLADFSRFLAFAILALAAVNFILAIVFGYSATYSFLASVALAVAAIPEMLPPLVTVLLALAATAMAHRKALVRKLPAAETLGSATVICSDKTGTLTKNQMTVVRIYCSGKDYHVTGVGYDPKGSFLFGNTEVIAAYSDGALVETLKAGYFCNDAILVKDEEGHKIMGDPTEGALVVSAAKAGITEKLSRLDTIPFEPEQQYMATLHEGEEDNLLYVKGSPERVLQMCQQQFFNDGIEPLRGEEILTKVHEMANEALRVLGMAYKFVPKEKKTLTGEDLHGLIFLGLQGMIDPPREEAIEAIGKCTRAGIKVVMITGDHPQTARAIANQLEMDADRVLTGEELSRMTDSELYEVVDAVSVYARVAPEHKFRITTQLQQRGHIVAVTGDGVNDAPALKAADIGIAMGITGTEVSKEASDMVLTDDNFATIVNAVEEGRHALTNLEKAILYTLPTNGGQALLIAGAILLAPFVPLFAVALPMAPIHILWVNMADSAFLTMPLILERKEKGLLRRPPRDPKEKIANRLFFERVGLVSAVMAAWGFLVYHVFGAPALSSPVDTLRITQAQTAAFMAVIWVHLGYILTARSVMRSAFTFSPFSNKWILAGMAITLVCQLAITYVPAFQSLFRTAAFPTEWWLLIVLGFVPGFFIVELEKFVRVRLQKGRKR